MADARISFGIRIPPCEAVREVANAARAGIRGVPCFLLEEKYVVMGAQETAALADAIRQVAAAKGWAS